jgi:hypothetical protein
MNPNMQVQMRGTPPAMDVKSIEVNHERGRGKRERWATAA